MKKIVFISGGSSGLGQVLTQKLSLRGFKVYCSYLSKKPSILNRNIKYIKLDITQDKSCSEAIKKVVKVDKRIDILINCVGITPSGSTLDYSSKEFADILQVNTIGPFRLMKEVAPIMKKGGLIVNVTSLNGFLALPHSGIYSSSKFALESLGLSLRNELKLDGINLVNIAPGVFVGDEERKIIKKNLFRLLFPFTTRDRVADGIISLIQNEKYPPRVVIGTDAKIAYLLTKILPLSLLYGVIGHFWQKRGSLALRS